MDTSSTPHKGKQRLGRLWSKIKLALRLKKKKESAPTNVTEPSTQIERPQVTQSTHPIETELSGNSSLAQPTSTQPVTTTITTPLKLDMPTSKPADIEPDSENAETPTVEQVTPSTSKAVVPPKQNEELLRRYERAQAMFQKYNLEFTESEWDIHPKPQGERVFKTPRMRVRWTCHECKTTFGHDKVCVECAHRRCRACVRYPPKKRKARAAKMAALAATISEDQEREGVCHECQTNFDAGAEQCSNCQHVICERCLQEIISSTEPPEPLETQTVPAA